VALVHERKPAGAEQWEKLGLHFCARARELGQSWPFRTGSTVIPKIVQDALNEHLFTGAVVDNIEEDMVIEDMQEQLELEAGPFLKQELLVTPPTKRSKPTVSAIFKEVVESMKESESESHERQLLIVQDIVQISLNP